MFHPAKTITTSELAHSLGLCFTGDDRVINKILPREWAATSKVMADEFIWTGTRSVLEESISQVDSAIIGKASRGITDFGCNVTVAANPSALIY